MGSSDALAESLDSLDYNVLPYFASWHILPSGRIADQVYAMDKPMIYYLKELIPDDAACEKTRVALGLDGIYSLVSTDDLADTGYTSKVRLNIQIDDLTQIKGKTIRIKNGSKIVKEVIFPAYTSLASSLTSLLGSGKNEKGLCYLKHGRDYYEYLVYENTGCADSIADIQTMIGQKRLSDLSEAAALTDSNPSLWKDAQKASLSYAEPASVLEHLKEQMQADFPKAPDVSYTVSPIEECMEDYLAPAYYITAPIDDYNANSIYINAKTDASTMRYFTTLAHEGFPGHLYQTIMSYQSGLPAIRSILNYPGYVEGWATYVEMMSYHYAGLREDAATLLALNQSALLSLYASTDIGIHYDGWSLADTIKFWNDYGISDPDTIAEIYRYIISEPANYLRYYVGYLQFLELKDYAKEIFGSDYNEISFHQAVLSIGPAPFQIVKDYLKDFYQK